MTLLETVRWDEMIALGYRSIEKVRLRRKRGGEFSPERVCYQVEYAVRNARVTALEPWFLELCDHYVLSDTQSADLLRRRSEFYSWVYDGRDRWYVPLRIVGWGSHLRGNF